MASTLILGGARSGKSSFAEKLALETQQGELPQEVLYIATAQPFDDEMSLRIAHHQQRRPNEWLMIEEPLALNDVLQQEAREGRLILIDCLTLWLNNLLYRGDDDADIQQACAELAYMAAVAKGEVFLVSNEVGLGIVGESPLTRRFVDQSGWMNQKVAALASHVALISAGLPLWLKGGR